MNRTTGFIGFFGVVLNRTTGFVGFFLALLLTDQSFFRLIYDQTVIKGT
jgi:hypothetical protein